MPVFVSCNVSLFFLNPQNIRYMIFAI